MELDSQNPYDINEEAPLDYTFVNRDGIIPCFFLFGRAALS